MRKKAMVEMTDITRFRCVVHGFAVLGFSVWLSASVAAKDKSLPNPTIRQIRGWIVTIQPGAATMSQLPSGSPSELVAPKLTNVERATGDDSKTGGSSAVQILPKPPESAQLPTQEPTSIPSQSPTNAARQTVSEFSDSTKEATSAASKREGHEADGHNQGNSISELAEPSVTIAPPPQLPATEGVGSLVVPGPSSPVCGNPVDLSGYGIRYQEIYQSIPFSRVEYDANPSYRHDATMDLMLGGQRQTIIHRGATTNTNVNVTIQPGPSFFDRYWPYRYPSTSYPVNY